MTTIEEFFHSDHYRRHNEARLNHLAGLGLDLNEKRVLEVGSGPGDHTSFYLERGCQVTSVDARQECIDELKRRYPRVFTLKVDMNQPRPLRLFDRMDIIHCYGLLYHLSRPGLAIEAMAACCRELLLLETCNAPISKNGLLYEPEDSDNPTQAWNGIGCRPARQWTWDTLKSYFPYVYQTRTQPFHPEFPTDWTKTSTEPFSRIVLVASRRELDLKTLSPTLLDRQTVSP